MEPVTLTLTLNEITSTHVQFCLDFMPVHIGCRVPTSLQQRSLYTTIAPNAIRRLDYDAAANYLEMPVLLPAASM